MMRTSALLLCSSLLATLTACPTVSPEEGPSFGEGGMDMTTSEGESETDLPPGPGGGSTGSDTGEPPTDPDSGSGDSAGSDGSSTTGSPTGGGGLPLDCNGVTYSCTNGIDDDGDGLSDLVDPECTGPCDDDESSFQTGIPGDNVDCKQDCFFDGNSGQGEGCTWDLRCDPAGPGGDGQCAYTGNNSCNNQAPPDEQCIAACEPNVPPGCDCFGCCTVQTDTGPIDIFLDSSDGCALDNLDACEQCTPNEVCKNDCNHDECEVCFGETEPPAGCEENSCDFGTPCSDSSECADGDYCLLGCCYPPPVG